MSISVARDAEFRLPGDKEEQTLRH